MLTLFNNSAMNTISLSLRFDGTYQVTYVFLSQDLPINCFCLCPSQYLYALLTLQSAIFTSLSTLSSPTILTVIVAVDPCILGVCTAVSAPAPVCTVSQTLFRSVARDEIQPDRTRSLSVSSSPDGKAMSPTKLATDHTAIKMSQLKPWVRQ